MGKIEVIKRLLKTTSNFWVIRSMKKGKKAPVSFRNGIKMTLDLAEYRKMRDVFYYLAVHGFKVEKTSEGFIVKKSEPLFSASAPSVETLPFFELLLSLERENWDINQIDSKITQLEQKSKIIKIKTLEQNLFFYQASDASFVGPADSLMVYLLELEKGVYGFDFKGKTVLDVGGYCGESAVFFNKQGAKKIVIYEPIKAHHGLILKNIALNSINADLHEEGIGEYDGAQSLNFEDAMSGDFGILSKGNKSITIKTKRAADIITESHADVAKIDCEGAEMSLLSVPKEVLALVPFYIIEAHSKDIQRAITKKFAESEFTQPREPLQMYGETTTLNYFERRS
jgi:FkbM family methyltransferase